MTPPFSYPIGRYQFIERWPGVNAAKVGLVIDTTTGRCWSLNGEQWKDLGSPASPPSTPPEVKPLGKLLNLKPEGKGELRDNDPKVARKRKIKGMRTA